MYVDTHACYSLPTVLSVVETGLPRLRMAFRRSCVTTSCLAWLSVMRSSWGVGGTGGSSFCRVSIAKLMICVAPRKACNKNSKNHNDNKLVMIVYVNFLFLKCIEDESNGSNVIYSYNIIYTTSTYLLHIISQKIPIFI